MRRWVLSAAVGVAAGMLVVVVVGDPFAGADRPRAAESDAPDRRPTKQAVAPMAGGPPADPSAASADANANANADATAKKYPPPELVAACEEKAASIRREFGDKIKVIVDAPFVIAGDMSTARLRDHAKHSVVRPAKAMWASYFDRKPDKVITAMLFAGAANYKKYAARHYPDGGSPYYGYYTPSSRTMVMNINTGGGTLVHELTHALIVYDFPAVPTWFNEGLGSLHEQCNIGEDKITGLANWRLPGLHKAMADGTLRPLSDLIAQRDFYGARQGVNYAQARYFVMYMQHKGVLREFYRHFRKNATGSRADVKAVEHVFDKKIDKIEPEFLAWVKTLRFGR